MPAAMPRRLSIPALPSFVPTALRLCRDLLRLPTACALCGMGAAGLLCPACHAAHCLPRRDISRCTCCALPLPSAGARCGACLASPPAYDATIAAADYAAPLDQLALGLKFGARLAHAPLMAGLLRDALLRHAELSESALPDLLLPVPLGASRLRERGFNQAAEIARPLSISLGIPVELASLQRTRETRAQTSLQPDARRSNMAGAFNLPPGSAGYLQGRHIGVVDDVMTTGATLDAVARLLKRHGAARVTNLVVLRTPARH